MQKAALNKLLMGGSVPDPEEKDPGKTTRGKLGKFARAKLRRRTKNKVARESRRAQR